MKRFNYLGDSRVPSVALGVPRFHAFAVDNRIRAPLCALLVTLVVTVACTCVALKHLAQARQAYTVLSERRAANAPAVAEVQALRTRIAAQRRLITAVDSFRSTTLDQANALAWIGNHLPSDTWLHTLRYENGSYTLEGTSADVRAVANALLALRQAPATTQPELVSLRDEPAPGRERVRYTLRLEANR